MQNFFITMAPDDGLTHFQNDFFLQELQYARKEAEVRQYLEKLEKERARKLEIAKKNKELKECPCCCNDECLEEDLMPW